MAQFYKSYNSAMDSKGLKFPIERLGAPTHPGVAKQLEEFGKMLNQGIKNVEIGALDPSKFESIPTEHFQEIKRLAKVTDSKVSVHAPIFDLAGFGGGREGGNKWSEDQRKGTEEQLYSVLERTFTLTQGENIPIVVHAGNFPSQEYQRNIEVTEYDKEDHPDQKIKPLGFRKIIAVNQDTGDVAPLEYEKKYHLGEEKEEVWDPMRRLHNINKTSWDDEKLKMLQREKEIREIKEKMDIKIKQNEAIRKAGLIADKDYAEMQRRNLLDIRLMSGHIDDIHQKLRSEYQEVYDKFTRFAKPELKEESQHLLDKVNKEFKEKEKEYLEAHGSIQKIAALVEKAQKQKLRELGKTEKEITNEDIAYIQEETRPYMEKLEEKQRELMDIQLEQSKITTSQINKLPAPDLWRWVGEFSIDKTADTVSNAMARLFINHQKQGNEDKIPFVAMENFFVNTAMSTADELKKVVTKTRELLSEKLVKDAGINKKEADKQAEKLIGATWDVGHINNLRKAGYEGEELKKKLVEETKTISGYVKHVHITDNFGFDDSHLPPGMGNVPIPEILEQLEKKWSEMKERGELENEPRAIVEAGGFVAELGQNPTLATLEFFGSPLYRLGPSPYFWGPQERGITHSYSPYLESYIEFPQQHFNLYGSSFTTLPKSVGGQVGEGTSRFAGTPNQ